MKENKWIKYVKKFHELYNVPINDKPTFVKNRVQLRLDLIQEEYLELCEACFSEDLIEVADALGDLIYVVIGMSLEFGIPLEKVLDEIQKSNLSKLDNGKVIRREDGKVLKGPNFLSPNIEEVLNGRT